MPRQSVAAAAAAADTLPEEVERMTFHQKNERNPVAAAVVEEEDLNHENDMAAAIVVAVDTNVGDGTVEKENEALLKHLVVVAPGAGIGVGAEVAVVLVGRDQVAAALVLHHVVVAAPDEIV